MARIRLYYDKSGQIVRVEHRLDENYTEENSVQENVKWIVVESEDLEAQPFEELEIKRRRVVKRKRTE